MKEMNSSPARPLGGLIEPNSVLSPQHPTSLSSQENDFPMPDPFLPSEAFTRSIKSASSRASEQDEESYQDVFTVLQSPNFHVIMLSSLEDIPSRPLSRASTKPETLPPCTVDLFAGYTDHD